MRGQTSCPKVGTYRQADRQTERQIHEQVEFNVLSTIIVFEVYLKNVRFNPQEPSARVNQQELMPGSIHRSNGSANETDYVNIQRLNGNFASVRYKPINVVFVLFK